MAEASKMHNVCRTGLPRICVVMLMMHLELALSFQLQPHSRRQTVAALSKFGGDPRRIVMQVAGAQLLAPAPLPPAVSSRLVSLFAHPLCPALLT